MVFFVFFLTQAWTPRRRETSASCKAINESKQTEWMFGAVRDDEGRTPSTLREVQQRYVMPWPSL